MEIWKVVAGSNGDYEISSYGRLKSNKRNPSKILKTRMSHDGYIWYSLRISGVSKTKRANRLVAEAFIENPYQKPTVNHIDGNKLNNHVENLEWSTTNEQMKHAYKIGLKKPMRGTLHPKSLLSEDEVKEIRRLYKAHDKEFGMIPLSIKYGVSTSTIDKCVNKRSYKNV